MPTVLKKNYVYTTDKGRSGSIRLSETKAAAAGFVEAAGDVPPLGIKVNKLRHVGVRMNNGRNYQLPVPTRESNLYESIGQPVNWTISGTPLTGHTVGSTGEQIR